MKRSRSAQNDGAAEKSDSKIANAFVGKAGAPTDPELAAALGKVKSVWDRLVNDLERELMVDIREWSSYSVKAGWSLRLKQKARTILWLGPRRGAFVAAFVLGEKAMKAARGSKLPLRIVEILKEAPKYPEGTGVRVLIKSAKDLAGIKTLAAVKIAN